jgi:serine protease inhibitor
VHKQREIISKILLKKVNSEFHKNEKNLIVFDSVLDDLTSAVYVMLNAIYFKGHWAKPLGDDLVPGRFFNQQGYVMAEFMTMKHEFYFHDSDEFNARFLRLPFRGKKLAMVIILPKEVHGIDALVDQLNATNLNRALWYLSPVEVNVLLPKFYLEYTSHLNEAIKSLGIEKIFTNDAAFTITRGRAVDRKVSTIMQKAGIAIDEKGTTTDSANRRNTSKTSNATGSIDFKADHPFLFFIQDETMGNLLFAGKVTNPEQKFEDYSE